MMQYVLDCGCGQAVVKHVGSVTKIMGKVLILREDGTAHAICRACGAEVPIPVTVDKSQLPKAKDPRLYINSVQKSTRRA